MSDFTDALVLEPYQGRWRTTRPLDFEMGIEGSKLLVSIPSGYVTDLGTVPGMFRWIINPADAQMAGAFVVHDFLCSWYGFDRWLADAVLYEALGVLGVAGWKKTIIWLAVRAYATIKNK